MTNTRSPIVVVLGHVDHGKTTLLDALRKSDVVAGEAGGITQSIGASVVETQTPSSDGTNKKITFIDTPGHAAFSKMRGRGAKVADIALLIVAQDDGVSPQTKEAITIIKDSKVPFIVVGTKSDVLGVNAELVLGQLEKEEIFFEGRGGQVPFVSVSSKTGAGINDLIEMILLVSEVSEFTSDENAPLEAVVIESFKDKSGVVANCVVRNGKLKVGDLIFSENASGRVRALFDDKGKSVKEVLPGEPARVIGFSEVPPVGASVTKEKNNAFSPDLAGTRKVLGGNRRLSEDELPIVLKAERAGALEAIIASLPAKTVVVDSGVGDVNESDILNAKVGNAYVFAFEAKIPASIIKLAASEGVRVKRFQVIYEMIKEIEDILKGGKVEILGHAVVIASFPFNNKKVAGCKVTDGKIAKINKLMLMRGEKEIGTAKIVSLKKQKTEVVIVIQGEEFGVIMDPQLDFAVGDVLASVGNGK